MKPFTISQPPFYHLSFAILGLSCLLAGCSGCSTKGQQEGTADSLSTAVVPASTDTLWGFVGDGTSMHVIELVNTDATDTMLLEIEDDADHQATLSVGHEIGVAVQHKPNGEQKVLATFDK